MSQYQSRVIDEMTNTSTDMSIIIGRYKGSMEAFSETLLSLSRIGSMDDFTKKHLTDLAVRMQNMVAENEQLWQNRGKREATDIVELERA